MSECQLISVIYTELLRRGIGTTEDPVRIVKQWWTPEGELLFEKDEWKENKNEQSCR